MVEEKRKRKKTVSKKILQSIISVVGIFAIVLFGGWYFFVDLMGISPKSFHWVELLAGLCIVVTLIEIWGSEELKERWGLLKRYAKYKKRKRD